MDRDIILINYTHFQSTEGDLILIATERVYNYQNSPLVYTGIIISKIPYNNLLKRILDYQKKNWVKLKKDALAIGPTAFKNVIHPFDNVGWGGIAQDTYAQNKMAYMIQDPLTLRTVALHLREFNRTDYSKGKKTI